MSHGWPNRDADRARPDACRRAPHGGHHGTVASRPGGSGDDSAHAEPSAERGRGERPGRLSELAAMKPEQAREAHMKLGTILIPLDGSTMAEAALPKAM